MPRGTRKVYAGYCSKNDDGCNRRLLSVRFHPNKNGKSAKDHQAKFSKKYCPDCRCRKEVKFKEEKHSS